MIVQRFAWFLIALMMAPLVPVSSGAEARSTVVMLELERHDWLSDDDGWGALESDCVEGCRRGARLARPSPR